VVVPVALQDNSAGELTERVREAIVRSGLQPGSPHTCSYLPQQTARSLTFHAAQLAPGVYHALMDLNFRRSGHVLYRPACEQCTQCRNLRVLVDPFRPNRSQRRCRQHNRDLTVTIGDPVPTPEKHELYQRYLRDRHDRQMDDSWVDFCSFLYESPIKTSEVLFRQTDRLLAVGLIDIEPAAVSTVYCYFDPRQPHRALGVFNVLWTIDYCRRQRVPYLYLGYYIRDCAKMNYKNNFRPCEVLQQNEWKNVEG